MRKKTKRSADRRWSPLLPDFCAGWLGAKLDESGLPFPVDQMPSPVVIVLDDRDWMTEFSREDRFDRAAVAASLLAARSITISVYATNRVRLGAGRSDESHRHALSRSLAKGSPAVFVMTTSDRVRFWLGEARRHATFGIHLKLLDSEDPCIVLPEELS